MTALYMTSTEPTIRFATTEDAELIAELTRKSWSGKVAPSSSGHREGTERVANDLREGGALVIQDKDTAIGSLRWLPMPEDPTIWEILRLGILPQYRGKQLSKLLMTKITQQASNVGVQELRLAVRSDQPRLLEFYAEFGFKIAPELHYRYANPLEPAPIVMRRSLQQIA